jgi:energy-coupling factor transporter ATP-binding protein EcfA2
MFLLPYTFAAEIDVDIVDHHNVKEMIEGFLRQNPDILDSSKDKDIVIFLGNTGAGKSTVINYLSAKALQVNSIGDIVLENPHDSDAMAIGERSDSETFLPASVQMGDLLFYDLPGFKDTRGTARSMVNACLIKRIIENARSVKLIFVAGIDQITTDRGSSFKNLLNNVKQLIPNKAIENFSALVITKSHISRHGISDFLETKLTPTVEHDLYILYAWLEHHHITQMARPMGDVIGPEDRDHILDLIQNIQAEKVDNVNINVIFDLGEQRHITDIYNIEIEKNADKLLHNLQQFSVSDKNSLEKKQNYIMNDFRPSFHRELTESPLINLLRPISENLFQESLQRYDQLLNLRLEGISKEIDSEIKELEKQAEIMRRKEEEARRIQAENSLRLEQERAQKAEAELVAIRAAEEAKRQAELRAAQERERIAQQQRMQELSRENAIKRYQQVALREKMAHEKLVILSGSDYWPAHAIYLNAVEDEKNAIYQLARDLNYQGSTGELRGQYHMGLN